MLMNGIVGTLLAHMNYHTYITFMVVFTLVNRYTIGSNLRICLWLTVGCCWLLLHIITAYPVTSNDCAPM